MSRICLLITMILSLGSVCVSGQNFCGTLPVVKKLQKEGLVLDARPNAVEQITGETNFNGKTGKFTVINMNPFRYSYTIRVQQTELVSNALDNFLPLLFPSALGKSLGLESGVRGVAAAQIVQPKDPDYKRLGFIENRLGALVASDCKEPSMGTSCPAALQAGAIMLAQKIALKSLLDNIVNGTGNATNPLTDMVSFRDFYTDTFSPNLLPLLDENADNASLCSSADNANTNLRALFDLRARMSQVEAFDQLIREVRGNQEELLNLADNYQKDNGLKTCVLRFRGFDFVQSIKDYTTVANALITKYETAIVEDRKHLAEMRQTKELLAKLNGKGNQYFWRETEIKGRFEASKAEVAINRKDRVQPETNAQAGGATQPTATAAAMPTPKPAPMPLQIGNDGNGGGPLESGDATERDAKDATKEAPKTPTSASSNNKPAKSAGQIAGAITIGRPRFTLSGGLVYSPLPRRSFKSVKGFALDAQGNPTGNNSADVVGFDENSPRRLLPMVLLNSRVFSGKNAGLFFSFGVSAKHDSNVDIEYLVGPSVSLLNDRALFTFGAYGGKSQNLVNDVKIGDALPDTIGDAKLFRKSEIWKPGFAFTYSFSGKPKKEGKTDGSGNQTTGSATDDLSAEFRIGGIPFNLAAGFAYTSLEQRTYDEVVGFARDRQGNLTNGQTLTRIVGLSSNAGYRLTPLAMLHSRLIDFGRHSLYFTTGLTGKKTDNNFDIEYLLGGSVNIYRRKVFLTFGTFAGKQQLLGGNLFEGSQLGKDQSVTIQNRYVWKPAFSLSYDVSRIIPRPN